MATYILVSSRDRLEITITPALINILHDIMALIMRKPFALKSPFEDLDGFLTLENDIGPGTMITLLGKVEVRIFRT